jgi:hypothetical protein
MVNNTQKDPKDWVSGNDPMTGAQESYLKTLSEQVHKPDPTQDELTKAEASELIERLRDKAGIEETRHDQGHTSKASRQSRLDRRPKRR